MSLLGKKCGKIQLRLAANYCSFKSPNQISLASERQSRAGQRHCDVPSNKQQMAAFLWNAKLNMGPQIVRGLLQHSPQTHSHTITARRARLKQMQWSLFTFFSLCNISCAFLRFNSRCYKKLSCFYPFHTSYIYGESSQRQDHLLAAVCGDKDGFLCESQNQHHCRRCRLPARGCCSRRG